MGIKKQSGFGLYCFLFSLCLIFWATTQVQAGAKEEVAAATEKWAKAFNEKDLETMVSLYAPDAVFWGTTSIAMRTNPDEVREYFAGPFREGGPSFKMEIVEKHVRVYGDIGLNTGIIQLQIIPKDGKPRTLQARFSFAYQKRGDNWVIVDHHSSGMPKPR